MGVLSKEELLSGELDVRQERVPVPSLRGEVVIQSIIDGDAYEASRSAARMAYEAGKRGVPGYKDISEDTLLAAAVVAAGLAEPALTFAEVLGLRKRLGPHLSIIARRVMEISGLTEEAQAEREAALEADPFPDAGAVALPGVPAPAPEGSEPVPAGPAGDPGVRPDQAARDR